MSIQAPHSPSWGELYATAEAQAGHFTTPQAHAAGYSDQLLQKYLHNGRIERVQRGVYRLVHFPVSADDALVVAWLWTSKAGVFSHTTALALHELSDALPHAHHITVPLAWSKRRLRVPEGVVLHYGSFKPTERSWFGPVPMTAVERTIGDCIRAHLSPDLVEQAIGEAAGRGFIGNEQRDALRELLRATLHDSA